MFWNKNKSGLTKEKSDSICTTNNNLLECDIVSKIREYQKELDQIESIDISDIIKKYFSNIWDLHSVESTMIDIMRYLCRGNINIEKQFELLGKDLANWANKRKRIEELENNIESAKDKLGIK